MMPLVSIIVPVYKVEPYLRRCVDSILDQSFEDFELILVDDGSPDNCGNICDEYERRDIRVKVIHQKNEGLSSARNSGIKLARGEFLLFCDSDDYVSERWCENLVKCVSAEETRYIFGGINLVFHDGRNECVKKRIPADEMQKWPVNSFADLQLENQIGYAWNVLYYTRIIKDNQLYFSKEYIIEDLPFNLEYINHVDNLYFSGEAHYFYVQDERDSLSRKYYADGFRKWREKYSLLIGFIEKNIRESEKEEAKTKLADTYLFMFMNSLDNTFDSRNKSGFIEKMKYNQRVVEAKEFQDCLAWAKNYQDDKRVIWLLKKKNYPLVWILNLTAKLKKSRKERLAV